MLEIETLRTFDTEYSADSVEWNQGDYKNYFVVGTYQLEETDANISCNNIRKGRIYLFHYDDHSNELTNCQQVETDAILDQKWRNETTLMTATSAGTIQAYKLNSDNKLSKSREISLICDGEENLALSLDVQEGSSKVISSDSKGRLSLLDIEAAQPLITQWKAHNFEAWTCAFDRYNKSLIYSGGDDSTFNVWDVRTSLDVLKLKSSTRDAGVTSFLNYKENTLFVGSYDEKLCSYDLRNLKRSVDEIRLNGGVWRIKSKNNLLLLSCMYHNFSIVDCTSNFKLIGEFFEHKSICYGCDWAETTSRQFEIFASCSFYDHKLSVCKVKL